MGITMADLDNMTPEQLAALDAKRSPANADEMRAAALGKLRNQAPATRTAEMTARTGAASPRMIGYVMVLLRQLDELNADVAVTARAWWMDRAIVDEDTKRVVGSHLSGNKVSDVINRLKAQLEEARKAAQTVAEDAPAPVAPVTTPAPVKPAYDVYDDVTDGNYAITDADGKNRFYRISRKEGKGKYAGRTFLNIQERASEELFPVRGPWAVRARILNSIRTAGVEAAHLAYSTLLKRCWHCHTTITDNTGNPHFARGLGPYCGEEH